MDLPRRCISDGRWVLVYNHTQHLEKLIFQDSPERRCEVDGKQKQVLFTPTRYGVGEGQSGSKSSVRCQLDRSLKFVKIDRFDEKTRYTIESAAFVPSKGRGATGVVLWSSVLVVSGYCVLWISEREKLSLVHNNNREITCWNYCDKTFCHGFVTWVLMADWPDP